MSNPNCKLLYRATLYIDIKLCETKYIYLINHVRRLHWENIDPRSWQYGSSAARSIQKRQRADILPVWSQASLVNKRFISPLNDWKQLFVISGLLLCLLHLGTPLSLLLECAHFCHISCYLSVSTWPVTNSEDLPEKSHFGKSYGDIDITGESLGIG